MEKQQRIDLDGDIRRYYRALKRRSSFLIILAGIIALAAGGTITMNYLVNDHYQTKQQAYQSQLDQLQQEHDDILSGKIQPPTADFNDTLQERLQALEDHHVPTLKDFSMETDTISVRIDNSLEQIQINKNNIFVSDNANMLNDETKEHLYDLNKQLAASTNGSQLEVITVYELPEGEDIETLANTLFNQLGIGNKTENNGVLYLIALHDRKFRLEVGYGLEGLIPDATADDIINDDGVVELFKKEKYDAAVMKVVNRVFGIMNTKTALVDARIQKITAAKKSATLFYWGILAGLILSILLAGLLIATLSKGQRALRKAYQDYLPQNTDPLRKKTDLYYLFQSPVWVIWTAGVLQRGITRGKLLQRPGAKQVGLGRVLVGDTLYNGNGDILTTSYLSSNYNSSNWSSSDSSSSNDSWGSFGGGSSGGGGASGGW